MTDNYTDSDLLDLENKIQNDLEDWVELARNVDDLEKLLIVAPLNELVTRNIKEFVAEKGGTSTKIEDVIDVINPTDEEAQTPEPGTVQETDAPEWGEGPEDIDKDENPGEWLDVELDDVSGVGPKTLDNIKDTFETPEDILNSGLDKLEEVGGVGKSTAQSVINKLEVHYNEENAEEGDQLDEKSGKLEEEEGDELEDNEEETLDTETEFASDPGFYNTEEEEVNEEETAEEDEDIKTDERKHNPDLHEVTQNTDMSEEEIEEISQFT